MLYTLFSWCIIGISSLGLGLVINKLLVTGFYSHSNSNANADNEAQILHFYSGKLVILLLLGLAFLTAYAQAISLVMRLGAKSVILVCIISLSGYIFLLYDYCKLKKSSNNFSIIRFLQHLFDGDTLDTSCHITFLKLATVIAVCLLFVMCTSTDVLTYDSSLYHAQAIHWIEDYGIVPGLGNLYHRLAYNSSFFCLQALFGFRWLLGDSLHSVNGFVAWILVSWSICTIYSSKNIAGKLLRILLIWFLSFDKLSDISSPNSDIFVLSLVIFIFINWIENSDLNNGLFNQSILCLLAVFAFTLKLSAALMVVLAIIPALELIKRQKYRYICVLIIIGVVCIFPFLARNYLISGYLLYPYPQINLFNVDWKMSPYMSAIDAAEIKMWGRGIPDVMQVHAPLTTWLQIWLSTSKTMSFLLILDILVLPIVIWKAVKIILAKNIIPADKLSANSDRLSSVDNKLPSLIIALVVAYLNGILWFIGAPLPRYGSIYLFIILVCNINIFLSDRLEISASKETKGENKFYSLAFIREINTLALTVSILMLLSPICYAFSHDFDLLTEKRIWGCNMTATDSLGVDIYYPTVADDLIGYDNFPSTPYTDILDKIELCGSSIADGFRLKTEFKDALIVGNGNIHEKDILKQTQ